MIQDGTLRDEEETNKIGGGGNSPSSGISVSGNVNNQAPTSSGRYTNLSRYIDKNRGATNQTLNKAKSDIGGLEGNTANYRNAAQNITDSGIRDYGTIRSNIDMQTRAANDPYSMLPNIFNSNTAATRDPINRLDSEQQRLSGLTQQRDALSSLADQGGVRNYLDSIRGNRAGSAGGKELDTFLLSSTPESQKDLGDISRRAGSLNLDASPQAQQLESAYSGVNGYDPNVAKGQIQNRLQADLDVNNGESVNRYNRIQEMLGNPTRAQFVMRPIEVNTPSTQTPSIGVIPPMGAAPGTTNTPATSSTAQTPTPQTGSGNAVPAGRPGQGQGPGGNATMGGARPASQVINTTSPTIWNGRGYVTNPNYRGRR